MNFRTYEELTDCIIKNLHKIPRDIDLIVGIPRSGTMVASILALYLNLPFTDVENFVNQGVLKTGNTRKCKGWIKRIEDAEHVLVVDDSISSGRAIEEVKARFRENNVSCRTTFLAIYALKISCRKTDIYFELCEQPRMFEWNYMHHWALEYCCIDIDGIICEEFENNRHSNTEEYVEALKKIEPKLIPTQKVGCLVTDRWEKCREETEKWLRKYSIDYEQLILTNNKAEIYKKSKSILFFENDYEQALEICNLSGKPVFCVGERKLITSDNVCEKIKNRQRELHVTVDRVVRKILNRVNYIE